MDKLNTKTIAISFTEGRVIRDFFENGLIDILKKQNINIVFFTPAERVPYFRKEWENKGVKIYPLLPFSPNTQELKAERKLARIKKHLKYFYSHYLQNHHTNFRTSITYRQQLIESKCDLLLITNPMYRNEISLWSTAKKLGIPVIGALRSWDNLHQGLKIYPDKLLVWNEVNKQEAIELMGIEESKIAIIGACQFDVYFDPKLILNKEELCSKYNLNPNKPIITIATIGELWNGWDENGNIDQLLELNKTEFNNELQFIIRLHPGTKYERMMNYDKINNVCISHVTKQVPTLGWYMDKEDVGMLGSILKHSDLVISPGSTITIETAIFDTPTLFPIYNYYQPEFGVECYKIILPRHHKRLRDLKLIPFIEAPRDLLPAIKKALEQPNWFKEERKRLFNDYIVYNDGQSTHRLAKAISDHIA